VTYKARRDVESLVIQLVVSEALFASVFDERFAVEAVGCRARGFEVVKA
jgi:hypothetical protein